MVGMGGDALVWSRIVVKSWMDAGFREELLKADSGRMRAICREMGYELPAHIELTVRPFEGAGPGSTVQEQVQPGNTVRIEMVLPPPPEAEAQEVAIVDYVRTEIACFLCICC